MQKLIVISAPSGAGKTSIVRFLLKKMPELSFSISACSRKRRNNEINGEDYYFLGVDRFKDKIKENAFLEWEEVYENQFYGTLTSEVERISNENKTVIFDVDVVGGLNIKKKYLKNCLAIFVMPPSLDVLTERLKARGSECERSLQIRMDNATEEISRNNEFDSVILNDNFNHACEEIEKLITAFINYKK
jgi:guanylate kinase